MSKINIKSDFKILVEVLNKNSQQISPLSIDFEFKYSTRQSKEYIISNLNGIQKNCKELNGKLLLIFENHNFNSFRVKEQRHFFIPDKDFEDKINDVYIDNEIDLNDCILIEKDLFSYEQIILSPYIKGEDAYDSAVKGGYNGDKNAFYNNLSEFATNESNRTSKENYRILNEKQRESNELIRVENEENRINQEDLRLLNESIRVDEEIKRINQEIYRENKSIETIEKSEEATLYANLKGLYAKEQGDYAKGKGDIADNSTNILNELKERVEENESFRISSEDVRIKNESGRITYENTRKSDEIIRVNNESSRKTNESNREINEDVRQLNETARSLNESKRIKNEDTRKNNETARVDAESIRSTNEVDRTSKESTRVINESDRISTETQRLNSETARKSAEDLRISDESLRKNAESVRVNSESQRVSSENNRKSSESQRINSENTRSDNENERILNENARIASEEDRAINTASAITNANNASIAASDASNYAITQGDYAKEQGDYARDILNSYPFYYGIEWDVTISNPVCTRIGWGDLHKSLPIQSRMRRCLLLDDGTVNYYLHPNNSTKRYNGAAANLTGADGQVMVEIPDMYVKFEIEGNKRRCLMSTQALPGFVKWGKHYVSAYEATVERTTSKLASVVNTTPEYRGGGNQAGWDMLFKSQLGKPATDISLTNFRAYARNRGSINWNCNTYQSHKALFWLFAVEYANFNSQDTFNAALTVEGYRQGGLGKGITDMSNWDLFDNYPIIPCGVTNPLGNRTGVIDYVVKKDDVDTLKQTISVPSYRGIENPFGHLWKWTDGCKCIIQSYASGGISEFYVCDTPANFTSSGTTNYQLRGNLPRTEGYVKEVILGEYGEIIPLSVGAGSTIYFCDYFYTSIPASGISERGVIIGGSAYAGAAAGLAFVSSNTAASLAYTAVGSRICFIP